MWYPTKNNEIDYSKPIIAENPSGQKQLLLPQIEEGYEVKSFNWLNLKNGTYDSCCHFKTPQEAVEGRKGYDIYNVELTVTKI